MVVVLALAELLPPPLLSGEERRAAVFVFVFVVAVVAPAVVVVGLLTAGRGAMRRCAFVLLCRGRTRRFRSRRRRRRGRRGRRPVARPLRGGGGDGGVRLRRSSPPRSRHNPRDDFHPRREPLVRLLLLLLLR